MYFSVGGMLQAVFCPMALPGSGHTAPFRPSHHSGYQRVQIHGVFYWLMDGDPEWYTFIIFRIPKISLNNIIPEKQGAQVACINL